MLIDKILVSMHHACDADIVAWCSMVNGITYSQCAGMQHTTKLSTHCEYTVAHLQDDLRCGFLCLKSYVVQHNAFTVNLLIWRTRTSTISLNPLPTSTVVTIPPPRRKLWQVQTRRSGASQCELSSMCLWHWDVGCTS